jgi:proline iminopeptidase
MEPAYTEGSVSALGFRLYYRVFGQPRKGTILCLHGGPGLTHDYMLPLADLARYGYRVVFYDQLGCGKSETTKNVGLFTVERAMEEVEAVRKGMGLKEVHLIGSSYGGLLALEYAVRHQKNVRSLTTIGGISNMPFVIGEMGRMKSRLPPEVLSSMERHESRGEYASTAYQRGMMVFYKRHFCRLEEWPKELLFSIEHTNPVIFSTMNGPAEFTIVGGLRYWNNQDRLRKIRVPTLVICGKYDEVSPREARNIHRRIRGSKLVIFPNSSHLAMWEEREACNSVIRELVDGVRPTQ